MRDLKKYNLNQAMIICAQMLKYKEIYYKNIKK